MSDKPIDAAPHEQTPLDPKEEMRLALERKNAAPRTASKKNGGAERMQGSGPHGKAGGKRVFRRKSG